MDYGVTRKRALVLGANRALGAADGDGLLEGWALLNLGCPPKVLTEALDRMVAALDNLDFAQPSEY